MRLSRLDDIKRLLKWYTTKENGHFVLNDIDQLADAIIAEISTWDEVWK